MDLKKNLNIGIFDAYRRWKSQIPPFDLVKIFEWFQNLKKERWYRVRNPGGRLRFQNRLPCPGSSPRFGTVIPQFLWLSNDGFCSGIPNSHIKHVIILKWPPPITLLQQGLALGGPQFGPLAGSRVSNTRGLYVAIFRDLSRKRCGGATSEHCQKG